MSKIFIFILITVVIFALLGTSFIIYSYIKNKQPSNEKISQIQQIELPEAQTQSHEIIAQNLTVPWALAFLPGPNQNILVTERSGTVKLISENTQKEIGKITVSQKGESGLHGIAVHPNFPNPSYIYLYYTYSTDGDQTLNEQVLSNRNRVSRFTLKDPPAGGLTDEKIIVDKIPGAIFHDGGRIKFGPDGNLYITTGDALNPSLSQNKNSLAGKILRVTSEDEPEVFSYGHRNPQGITWDDKGNLWESEHGNSATDEINLIEEGKNYGWPTITGDQIKSGLETPKIQSGTNTWAPAGMAFYRGAASSAYNGSLFFGGLRGQALFEYNIATGELKEHFKGEFGRIRDVVLGPDNMLYITTSNLDGRGSPKENDDKIIRINPEKL